MTISSNLHSHSTTYKATYMRWRPCPQVSTILSSCQRLQALHHPASAAHEDPSPPTLYHFLSPMFCWEICISAQRGLELLFLISLVAHVPRLLCGNSTLGPGTRLSSFFLLTSLVQMRSKNPDFLYPYDRGSYW